MFPSQFVNIFLTYQTFVTNFLRVELRCKLQGKLHRVTELNGKYVKLQLDLDACAT